MIIPLKGIHTLIFPGGGWAGGHWLPLLHPFNHPPLWPHHQGGVFWVPGEGGWEAAAGGHGWAGGCLLSLAGQEDGLQPRLPQLCSHSYYESLQGRGLVFAFLYVCFCIYLFLLICLVCFYFPSLFFLFCVNNFLPDNIFFLAPFDHPLHFSLFLLFSFPSCFWLQYLISYSIHIKFLLFLLVFSPLFFFYFLLVWHPHSY